MTVMIILVTIISLIFIVPVAMFIVIAHTIQASFNDRESKWDE
jgi:hypothetical protein